MDSEGLPYKGTKSTTTTYLERRYTNPTELIFSPDTDVYHIGLTLMQSFEECHIIIQLSKHTHDKARYRDMNNLIAGMENDPDLSQIPPHLRPQVLQTIYICTGCDYTSFFNGIGKVSFLSTFFQHATFIAAHTEYPGSLGSLDSMTQYSFLQLIGCAYFKQHSVHRHQQHSSTVAKMEPVFTMIMIRGLLLLGTQEGNESTLSQTLCPPQRHCCCTGKGVSGC